MMKVLVPVDTPTDIPEEHIVRFVPGSDGQPEVSALPQSSDYVWITVPGAEPLWRERRVIQHWLDSRSPAGLVGNTQTPSGYITHPRPGRYSAWTLPLAGESIIVATEVARETLANLVHSKHWFFQLVLASSAHSLERIPIPISHRVQPPGAHSDHTLRERAEIVSEVTGLDIETDGTRLLPRCDRSASVSVIIPSIGARLNGGEPAIIRCVRSLLDTAHFLEVIVVAGPAMPDGVLAELATMLGDRLVVERVDFPFNFSHSCNVGVSRASAEHVLLLNDDVEATARGWLEQMQAWAALPDVGAVGARLLFDHGAIQHAGIVINPRNLEPNHLYFGLQPDELDDPVAHHPAEFLAVTGACLLVRRELYNGVGGFTTDLPLNYNDVDFCLKLIASGLTNIQCNNVSLTHSESTSRTPVLEDFEKDWMSRWEPWIGLDPYSNVWL